MCDSVKFLFEAYPGRDVVPQIVSMSELHRRQKDGRPVKDRSYEFCEARKFQNKVFCYKTNPKIFPYYELPYMTFEFHLSHFKCRQALKNAEKRAPKFVEFRARVDS